MRQSDEKRRHENGTTASCNPRPILREWKKRQVEPKKIQLISINVSQLSRRQISPSLVIRMPVSRSQSLATSFSMVAMLGSNNGELMNDARISDEPEERVANHSVVSVG